MKSTAIFQLYHDIQNQLPIYKFRISTIIADKVNVRISQIVTDPNYDPIQWVTEFYKFERYWIKRPTSDTVQFFWPCVSDGIYRLICCLNCKHYNFFPGEWWELIYRLVGRPYLLEQVIQSNPYQCEEYHNFLKQMILLYELQENQ